MIAGEFVIGLGTLVPTIPFGVEIGINAGVKSPEIFRPYGS